MIILDATPERLTMRPNQPHLLRFPLAFGRAEHVLACDCGYLSEPHESADRAAALDCPCCMAKGDTALRRKEYLVRLTEALQVHPR